LYFEPYFKYVHHTSEGTGNAVLSGDKVVMNFTNDYNGVGAGVQLGAQFLISKKFVIDLFFLGPEINSSKNNFKAVETSTTLPWTSIQANEAEQDIRDFIDQFPFIRHRVNITVDQNNGVQVVVASDNLTNTNFSGSQLGSLSSPEFEGSTGTNTDFSSTNLKGANFTGVNLSGTKFRGADLTFNARSNSYTFFAQATLNNPDFTNANLTGVQALDTATLTSPVWSNTTCPDFTNSDANGGTCVGHLAP